MRLLLTCLLLWSAGRLLLAAGVDLGKDEAAYWYWSRHLDVSYAWLPFFFVHLGDWLLPGSDVALRLPFLTGGVVSVWLLYSLCRLHDLSPARSAVAAAAFATSHWIWHTSSFLHPDGFLVPMWLASLVSSQLASRGDDRWWFAAGVCAGLASLSKYSGLVLAAGLLLHLLWLARSNRRPLLLAAPPFLLITAPLLLDLLQTGFALPTSLSSLSAVAPPTPLLRLGLFLGAPLLYVSPLLLFVLYRGAWSMRGRKWPGAHWSSNTHIWLPGLLLVGCFAFFALYRGQVKGNWILPAFLGIWPLCFAYQSVRRRWIVSLLLLGAMQALIPAVSLRWPAVAETLSRTALEPLNASYTSIVSRRDLPREPTFSWTERVCEYHGWEDFGERLDAHITRLGLEPPVTIVSTEYGLAFGAVRYADLVDAAAVSEDLRFARVAAPARQAELRLARIVPGIASPGAEQIERYSAGCAPLTYAVSVLPEAAPEPGSGASGARDSAEASRR